MAYNYYKIKNIAPEEIGKMTKKQLEDFVADMRQKLESRKEQFAKSGRYVYSPALEKINEYYESETPVASQSRNKLMAEAFRLQDFFNAKTATVKGSRKVMREQDIRIFGVNERGLPRKKMTSQQREKFWKFYDEFLNQKKNAYARFGSNAIQQYLGEIIERSNLEISPDYLDAVFSALDEREKEKEENNGITSANVYFGKWRS